MPYMLSCSYASHVPRRLDSVLAEIFPHISRTKLSQCCNYVSVNATAVKLSHKVRYRDGIMACVEMPVMRNAQGGVYNAPLDPSFAARIEQSLLYRDETLLVLNKQRGDVVHVGPGHGAFTIAQAVFPMLYGYREADAREGRAGIVHRLDKDTSGVLLVARTAAAHDFYAQQFAQRAVKKNYLSVLKGSPPHREAEVLTYIARHAKNRKKFCNYAQASHGKEARSRYHVLASSEKYSLVQWNILTGRTHQIRLHAQHIGAPVLGDVVYARAVRDATLGTVPLMLHAWKLEIALYSAHAVQQGEQSVNKREFCAPVPQDMREMCARLFDYTL